MPRDDAQRQALLVWVEKAKAFQDLLDVYADRVSAQGALLSDVNATGPVLQNGALIVPASLYLPAQGDWEAARITASIMNIDMPAWPFRTNFGVDLPMRLALPQYKAAIAQLKRELSLFPPLTVVVPAVLGVGAVLGAFWYIGKQQ